MKQWMIKIGVFVIFYLKCNGKINYIVHFNIVAYNALEGGSCFFAVNS